MDSSIGTDPFAPENTVGGAAEPTAFREARFRSVGATEEEIADFRAAFNELDPVEQADNNLVIDEADDAQMVAWLEEHRSGEIDENSELDAGDGLEEPVVVGDDADSAKATPVAKSRSATARKAPGRSR